MTKIIATLLFGVTGTVFVAYAAFAANLLAGGAGQETIAIGGASNFGHFLRHLLSPDSSGISYAFYSGMLMIVISIMIFLRGKAGK